MKNFEFPARNFRLVWFLATPLMAMSFIYGQLVDEPEIAMDSKSKMAKEALSLYSQNMGTVSPNLTVGSIVLVILNPDCTVCETIAVEELGVLGNPNSEVFVVNASGAQLLNAKIVAPMAIWMEDSVVCQVYDHSFFVADMK